MLCNSKTDAQTHINNTVAVTERYFRLLTSDSLLVAAPQQRVPVKLATAVVGLLLFIDLAKTVKVCSTPKINVVNFCFLKIIILCYENKVQYLENVSTSMTTTITLFKNPLLCQKRGFLLQRVIRFG